jgi:hypothetical protein
MLKADYQRTTAPYIAEGRTLLFLTTVCEEILLDVNSSMSEGLSLKALNHSPIGCGT